MHARPVPIEPGPGQESVWEYPRPAIAVRFDGRVRVIHRGVVVADTDRCERGAVRVLETSHPPGFYVPPESLLPGVVVPAAGSSVCEWKGRANYWSLSIEGDVTAPVGWSYETPTQPFAILAGFVSFYPQAVDECWVDDERARPSPGSFYGGWITSAVVGPFKGEPGSMHW